MNKIIKYFKSLKGNINEQYLLTLIVFVFIFFFITVFGVAKSYTEQKVLIQNMSTADFYKELRSNKITAKWNKFYIQRLAKEFVELNERVTALEENREVLDAD